MLHGGRLFKPQQATDGADEPPDSRPPFLSITARALTTWIRGGLLGERGRFRQVDVAALKQLRSLTLLLSSSAPALRVHSAHPALSLSVLHVTDSRILESLQRYSSSPTYLPVNYHLLNTESSFFLKEATQDFMRNSSLLSRTELFFIHQARRPPVITAGYGTLSVEQPVPVDLLQTPGTFVTPSTLFTFNWKVQTFVLTEKIFLDKPKVQVLFYAAGRDWDDYTTVDKLPCVRMFAFHETQEVRGSCRLRSELGICVAELEPLPGWFAPPSVVPGRQRGMDLSKGTPVELYYSLHVVESGECLGEDTGDMNSARLEQESMFGSATSTPMRRIGSVRLFRTPAVPELSEHRLDGNFAVLVPLAPVRPRDSVSAYVAASPYSPVEMFTLRVKLKDGVAFLGARPCNPTLWMVSQDVRTEGHKVVTLHCRRKESSYGQRLVLLHGSRRHHAGRIDRPGDRFVELNLQLQQALTSPHHFLFIPRFLSISSHLTLLLTTGARKAFSISFWYFLLSMNIQAAPPLLQKVP
ncbi:transmembrane protein 132C-like [Salminus brasiliensis]|uniref:transmembrane protein 132C-like n=1 Tax=Salminus brasiliensis TaxID=930266 RepID=UPI003B838E25